MKTLDLTKATKALAAYTQDIDKEPLVVVKNGKPVAVLSSARGMDKESLALANNPRFAQLIKRSRARHAAEGGIPLAQVYKRLGIKPPQKRPKRKAS
jgi:PHD/YefM family antitoxin component YafN of YafNO toxin-antitoxin module